MIKLLNKNEVIFRSQKSETEIVKILSDNINAKNESFFGGGTSNSSKPFLGIFKNNKFEIKKTFTGRNTFIPIIKGEISKEYNGTIIRTNITPQKPWLLIIWFIGMTLGFLLNLYVYFNINHDKIILFSGLICLPMIVGIYLVQKFYIKESTNRLKEILSAEIDI